MTTRRSGLGKGLEALIPPPRRSNLQRIAISRIAPTRTSHGAGSMRMRWRHWSTRSVNWAFSSRWSSGPRVPATC